MLAIFIFPHEDDTRVALGIDNELLKNHGLACQDSCGVSALHSEAPVSAPTAIGAVVSGIRSAHELPSSDRLQDDNLCC
jgi:hypothetical protein